MTLDHITGFAIEQLFGRLLRRALIALIMAIFAIVAIYHFSVAGIVALDEQVGEVHSRLIVGGIYTVLALVCLVLFWTMRGKPNSVATPALSDPRGMQLAMLVEAVMLGYALARKGGRSSR